MAGYFITFEGIDKSGKSTQARLLAEQLGKAGLEVVLTREPGGTALGNQIRSLVLESIPKTSVAPMAEMLLFAADRAQHVEELVRPNLQAGKVVISDRYVESTLAYQGYGRGMDLEALKSVQEIATDGLRPDLTFVIDVEVRTFRSRQDESDRMESGSDAYYEEIRNGYDKLQHSDSARFVLCDGKTDVKRLSEEIFKEVESRISISEFRNN